LSTSWRTELTECRYCRLAVRAGQFSSHTGLVPIAASIYTRRPPQRDACYYVYERDCEEHVRGRLDIHRVWQADGRLHDARRLAKLELYMVRSLLHSPLPRPSPPLNILPELTHGFVADLGRSHRGNTAVIRCPSRSRPHRRSKLSTACQPTHRLPICPILSSPSCDLLTLPNQLRLPSTCSSNGHLASRETLPNTQELD
jgi:hypothetical protein